ncbi:MAG: hypothetical protein HY721_17325 [Planctomycetes bacterium]|nr:hypothetical protein [Planctomycetota bacterium]
MRVVSLSLLSCVFAQWGCSYPAHVLKTHERIVGQRYRLQKPVLVWYDKEIHANVAEPPRPGEKKGRFVGLLEPGAVIRIAEVWRQIFSFGVVHLTRGGQGSPYTVIATVEDPEGFEGDLHIHLFVDQVRLSAYFEEEDAPRDAVADVLAREYFAPLGPDRKAGL